MVEEKPVFQNNYMKYLKTRVFYKLFLNNVHKNGDLKQKPPKCGTWQKQVMEIQMESMNTLSDLLASIWNKSRQITPQRSKLSGYFLKMKRQIWQQN